MNLLHQKNINMRYLVFCIITLLFNEIGYAQGCCAGGSGSPIAGGASTGVLLKNQLEIAGNYQFNYADVYFAKDSDTTNLIDGLKSSYFFLRADYGVSDKLTMSIASGYYAHKTLIELGYRDTVSSKGIGDLILFPRYSIFNKERENSRTEITIGIGLKIPLSSGKDSHLVGTSSNGDVYAISPPTVQTTTGSQDLMFYTFFYQGYQKRNLRFFANSLYIKKGYGPLGERFGDYASLGLYVGKTVFKNIGITMQLKGEWIGKMSLAETVKEEDLAIYSIEIASTGSKKVFFVPQLSYTYKNLTWFATSEIPMYQYLNGVQLGSLYQFTTGLSYRFLAKKTKPRDTFEIPVPIVE